MSLKAKTKILCVHRLLHCTDLTCHLPDCRMFLSEHLYIAFLHGYSFPVWWIIKKFLNSVLTLSTDLCYFCDIHLWFSRYSSDFEPVWKWFFWWIELWIFYVAPQPVNCCCVQCDCCGFYGGDNKYIGCVLCTCGFLSRVLIIQWWYSVCVHLDISDLIHNDWLHTQRCPFMKMCFGFTIPFRFIQTYTSKELFVNGHPFFM